MGEIAMNYTKECGTFPSSNGIDDVAYYIYKPLCEPKAVVQIVHGMCEYCGRYEDFISFLCANGITVCCHDQLGHGATAGNEIRIFRGGTGLAVPCERHRSSQQDNESSGS